eukprot:12901247-Prorocentrum_lima.AAC.1
MALPRFTRGFLVDSPKVKCVNCGKTLMMIGRGVNAFQADMCLYDASRKDNYSLPNRVPVHRVPAPQQQPALMPVPSTPLAHAPSTPSAHSVAASSTSSSTAE